MFSAKYSHLCRQCHWMIVGSVSSHTWTTLKDGAIARLCGDTVLCFVKTPQDEMTGPFAGLTTYTEGWWSDGAPGLWG